MKTQIRISEKYHLHFMWRLSFLCCVLISSFSLAQVYMGTTLVVVVKGTVVTGFSSDENSKLVDENTSQEERRLISSKKDKKRIKTFWINSESSSFARKPRVCHIVFRFSKTENLYFFSSYKNIVNTAIAQNFQPKSKAHIEVLQHLYLQIFSQINKEELVERRSEVMNIGLPVFFPRPPPFAEV